MKINYKGYELEGTPQEIILLVRKQPFKKRKKGSKLFEMTDAHKEAIREGIKHRRKKDRTKYYKKYDKGRNPRTSYHRKYEKKHRKEINKRKREIYRLKKQHRWG